MKNIVKSAISGANFELHAACKANTLKSSFFIFIKNKYPDFEQESYLGLSELDELRHSYLEAMVNDERIEISTLEEQVLYAIQTNSILSEQLGPDIEETPNLGERMADKIAAFGGSWTFIIIFFSILLVWMAINIALMSHAFDPFPFILLNLVLSCLAAIQAPIIMMSQNRQETKDRKRAEKDFKINLKAELELQLLHEKIDHILVHQNQRLFEIQELQTEFLHEIASKVNQQKT